MARRALLFCVLVVLFASGSAVVSAADHARGASPWTLRIAQTGVSASAALGSIDPAQAAGFFANQLLWSTCAFLYDYADQPAPAGGVVRPEVAAAFPTLRRRGRNYTYTIRVRSGFRYQDGRPVRAADFVHAIRRDLEPGLSSTGPSVLHDLVRATSHASSIAITMDRAAPDLPTMLSSTLFCAIPAGLPATPTQTAPMAGPYYIATYTPAEIVLKRNPHYGGSRPRNASEIDWMFQIQADAIALRVERGDADFGVISPAATVPIAARYGVNKSRFFVAPGYQTLCLALNTSRPLFANNPQLRRAVNYAIDRHALVASFGAFVGRRTDQFLAYGSPGFVDAQIYPITGPNFKKARVLAAGHTRAGTAVMYVRSPSPFATARAQIVQYDLKQIGIDVQILPFSPAKDPSRLGEPFDIVDRGCGDIAPYDDPYALLNLAFDGSFIHAGSGNTNLSYFNDPVYNKRLKAASGLAGRARNSAYAQLDAAISRDAAPAAPYAVLNHTAFVASRIGCVAMSPIYGASFGALCLKGA